MSCGDKLEVFVQAHCGESDIVLTGHYSGRKWLNQLRNNNEFVPTAILSHGNRHACVYDSKPIGFLSSQSMTSNQIIQSKTHFNMFDKFYDDIHVGTVKSLTVKLSASLLAFVLLTYYYYVSILCKSLLCRVLFNISFRTFVHVINIF